MPNANQPVHRLAESSGWKPLSGAALSPDTPGHSVSHSEADTGSTWGSALASSLRNLPQSVRDSFESAVSHSSCGTLSPSPQECSGTPLSALPLTFRAFTAHPSPVVTPNNGANAAEAPHDACASVPAGMPAGTAPHEALHGQHNAHDGAAHPALAGFQSTPTHGSPPPATGPGTYTPNDELQTPQHAVAANGAQTPPSGAPTQFYTPASALDDQLVDRRVAARAERPRLQALHSGVHGPATVDGQQRQAPCGLHFL